MTALDRVAAVTEREFRTALRSRSAWVLSAAFAVAVVGLAVTAGAGAYATAALDLVTPLEVLVPAFAFALSYRSVVDDRRRGELETVRTYPVTRGEFVAGVYLGRAAVVLSVVLVSLLAAGVFVATGVGVRSSVIASHSGADSPLLFVRFFVLVAGFALVSLAVGVAVSAVAGSVRSALALGAAVAFALVVGFDLGILVALSGGYLGEGSLTVALAFSPNSAFRGLVFSTVVSGVTGGVDVRVASPLASLVGLSLWWVGALALSVVGVWGSGR